MPSFVNKGAFTTGLVVSANAISGLDIAMPAGIVAGNYLMLHFACRVSANISDDVEHVDAASAVWNEGFDDNAGGMRQWMYWKFATGGEGPAKVMVTAVGLAGSINMKGICYQFANVHNPGTASFIEAAGVSTAVGTSGMNDQPVVVTGNNRLAINLMACNAAVSLGPNDLAGEVGGNWVLNSIAVTGNPLPMRLFSATMAAPGTIGGGIISGLGTNTRIVRGFALAPCAAATGAPPEDITERMLHHYIMRRAM